MAESEPEETVMNTPTLPVAPQVTVEISDRDATLASQARQTVPAAPAANQRESGVMLRADVSHEERLGAGDYEVAPSSRRRLG